MKKLFFTLFIFICFITNLFAREADEKISIYGCASQGYMKSDANNYLLDSASGSLQLREMLISFSSQVVHNTNVGAQITAIDLGDVGNNEIVLDWAFGDYQIASYLGIRAGRIKSGGVGLYNETRDVDIVRNGIFLPTAVYNPLLRDLYLAIDGAAIYGNIPMPGLGRTYYSFGVGTTSLRSDGLTGKWIENLQLLNDVTIDVDKIILASVLWSTPIDGFCIGASYLHSSLTVDGTINLNAEWLDRFGVAALERMEATIDILFELESVSDADKIELPDGSIIEDPLEKIVFSTEYIYNNLTLAAEYTETMMDRGLIWEHLKSDMRANTSLGYYMSAAYRFTDWLEIGLVYGMYFADKDDKDGKKAVYKTSVESRQYVDDSILAAANSELKKTLGPDIPELNEISDLDQFLAGKDFTAEEIISKIYPRIPHDFEMWQHTATISARFDITENLVVKMEYSAIDGAALTLIQDNPNREDLKRNWNLVAAKVIFVF